MGNYNRRHPKSKPSLEGWPEFNPRALMIVVMAIALALVMVLARTVTINGGIHIILR